jgi:enoyl-CoA hydratase/carnithine racemase
VSTIIYEVKDKIGYITLNRPEELNAMNDEMLAELDAVLPKAEMDLDAKVIVFKGAGKDFCAGQDLTGVNTNEVLSEPGEHMTIKKRMEAERRRNRRWEYIFNLAKPTIAQVHGHCLGTGCYLSMVCDITIASEDALFGDPLLRMGLLPHMPLWPYLVGIKKTAEMLYTGCYIDGIEAEKISLINKAVPRDELEDEVDRMAKGIALMNCDQTAPLKDAINSVMEARGLGACWRFTNDMQLVMQQRTMSAEEFNFFEVRDKKGLKAAIDERDAPFKNFCEER